ncbi:TPA: glycosyltransferase family 2 protein, partial [Enterobacter hormaechei subsp. xiangfangensis]
MTKPLISIIVLNWQNATETINCITSLLKLNYNNFNIIVCDNDSHDSSVSEMSNWCQSNQ